MGKWFGKIGFAVEKETEPGIFVTEVVEKPYYGEVLQSKQRYKNSQSINDSLILSNRLKILAEPFLQMNSPYIRYVTWKGARWAVSSITDQYPNLILELGEVYNGDGPY